MERGWRPTIGEMRSEHNASRAVLESRSKWRDDAIPRYTGSAYQDWQQGDERDPENTSFTQIAQMIPALASGTPQCALLTSRGSETQILALALQAAANRSAREQKMERGLERIAIDMLFTQGTAKILRAPRAGQEAASAPMNMPLMRYVPQRWFTHDASALDSSTWAWSGDARVAYVKDLLFEAEEDPTSGWNIDALESIQTKSLPDTFRAGGRVQQKPQAQAIDRGEIAIWEIWVRDYEWTEEELDEWEKLKGERPTRANGYNGALLTITDEIATDELDGEEKAWIRPPRPYYGPRWGPHIQFGCYVVPDESDPLGLIAATADQAEELNDLTRSSSRSSRKYKRVAIFSSTDAVDQIQQMGHDFIGAAPAMDFEEGKGWVEIEVGGVTDQQIKQQMLQQDRYDRNSGMDDAARGRADAQATATAVATAAGHAASRRSWILTKFQRGVQDVFRSLIWYLWHDDSMMVPLDEAAIAEMGKKNSDGSGWFFGGDDPAATVARLEEMRGGSKAAAWDRMIEQVKAGASVAPQDDPLSGSSFDDLEVSIDLSTLQSSGPEQEAFRSQQMQVAIQESMMVAQMPWVNPEKWVKMKARVMNMPQFVEVVDPKLMAAAQQAAQKALEQGGEESGDRPGLGRTGASAPSFVGKGDNFLGNMQGAMEGAKSSSSGSPSPIIAGASGSNGAAR